MSKFPTEEQDRVLKNTNDKAIVSASAGTGKTTTLIQYITDLIKHGVPVNRLLVVTFTNNAANEMKDRLLSKLMELEKNDWILNQIDDVLTADISTIHSFLQKIVKRNIDKLDISNDYYLLDEHKSKEIKNKAFDEAYERACTEEKLQDLLLSLHSEKTLLKSIIFALENHFAVLANPQEAIKYYKTHQTEIYELALKRMNKILVDKIFSLTHRLAKIFKTMDDKNLNFKYVKNYILELQKISGENTFRENIDAIRNLSLGRINNREEIPGFANIKESVSKLIKKFKNEQYDRESFWEKNSLVNNLYEFYNIYEEELKKIKLSENCLDFNDLEKLAIELLQDDKVAEEIQSNYDYVVIDEYQDTNPVQEKIMKILSQKCKFLAVGDPKQGIYGFRNATSEIMKKDIRDFSANGGVYYLTNNFRSDPLILKFVNDVFKNVMREGNTGIDYEKSSKFSLRFEDKYPKNTLPIVRIDLLKTKKDEDELSEPEIYDLVLAERVVKDKAQKEAELISQRINELLLSKIYDAKQGKFRDVNYSDITILVRGRGEVADRIVQELTNQGLPVISSLDKGISSNEEVEVIKSLLKLAIDYQDDVSLVSFLTSKLGGMTLDEVYKIRKDYKNKAFYEEFKESEKYAEFDKLLQDFKYHVYSKGVRFALEKLFFRNEYNPYLLSKRDGINIKAQIDKLLDLIENSGYNYDLPALIHYLNSSDIRISGTNSGLNAINITTIHASKGLEYPIVILAGMGKDLTRKDVRNGLSSFKISKEYGLALSTFKYSEGEKNKNILLTAIEEEKSRKEFVDEIMLLYVAMTRAKNHLYIVGEDNIEKLSPILTDEDIFENKSFIKLIISSLLVKYDKFLDGDHFEDEGLEFNIVDDVKVIERIKENKITDCAETFANKIEDYLDYDYPHLSSTTTRYKQSVTMINSDNNDLNKQIGSGAGVDVGIAYHTALEKLDLLNIFSEEDIKNNLDAEILQLIDTKILLKDINLLKPLIINKKIYKEKVFTMRAKANDVIENSIDENIMIQGIVDLFLIGEKNILVDYKFTNIEDEKILIKKYKKQLLIYKKAIENAYMLNLDEIYLLSLKYGKLIKLN